MAVLCAQNRTEVVLFPLIEGLPGLLVNNSATFKTTHIGRKSTPCVKWHMSDLPLPLEKSEPDQICEPEVPAQKGASATIFWRK
jgi:hypothetical protein